MDITKELPTVISFCSGYGGIERGLDLAGIEHRVIAYVEIEAFAIANLVNKMEDGIIPPAPIYTDLKTFPSHLFRGKVSILTSGYPCQPFSAAGQRKGEDDPRHLWPHIRRHIESIRPVQCFFENVEGHISIGLSTVISDLEEDGYRSTWGIFSAEEVGAPHRRKRVYILANPTGHGGGRELRKLSKPNEGVRASKECRENPASESDHAGKDGKDQEPNDELATRCDSKQLWAWPPEPRVGRVVDGCADRVDRIRLLGNGVVPATAAKAWLTLNEERL